MRFRGHCDTPLSEQGWSQMSQALTDAPTWSAIVSSPIRRCAEFATCCAETHGVALTFMDALKERDFGSWNGRTTQEIAPKDLESFWSDPVGFTPPDAEPFGDFQARVLDGWRKILTHPDPHTLLITHGGVIRLIIAEVLMMPDQATLLLEVPYASRTRLHLYPPPGRPSLVFHHGG